MYLELAEEGGETLAPPIGPKSTEPRGVKALTRPGVSGTEVLVRSARLAGFWSWMKVGEDMGPDDAFLSKLPGVKLDAVGES